MAADEETDRTYTWEGDYERTWEAIREDEAGSLQATVDDIILRVKRKRLLDKQTNVRLGMMRHLFIVIDLSRSMEDQDLKPTRLACTVKLLEYFIQEYFDHNPISQIGVVTTSNMRAEKLTELGGNPKRHIQALLKCKDKPCVKEPSIQNALEVAANTLRHMPGHASREILIILGSLTTCDPSNIHDTIKAMKEHNIRCSVIGLAAEISVCKKLCKTTNGTYGVILDESHFKDLLMEHTAPPPATANTEPSPIRMGFPQHLLHTERDKVDKPSMCMCHLDSKGFEGFSSGGYFCPQCNSKYCELPIECKVCGLTLVSAPHLARSFHHLFPLGDFTEVKLDTLENADTLISDPRNFCVASIHCQKDSGRFCQACQNHLTQKSVFQCPKCTHLFCLECELFIHNALHSCPGCASSRPPPTNGT